MSVNIKVNYKGVGELLNGSEVQEMLRSASNDVMSDLDMNDYDVKVVPIRTRMVAHIDAKTTKAILENLNENTLIKALGNVNK